MDNNTIRIALSSVLIYVSFKKLYDILTILLSWGNVEFRIESEPILVSLNIVLGLISILGLIGLLNKILSKDRIEDRVIFLLIGLATALQAILFVTNMSYGKYLSITDLSGFDITRVFQYSWSKIIDGIFPIIGLLYFLWKIKIKTVANNKR